MNPLKPKVIAAFMKAGVWIRFVRWLQWTTGDPNLEQGRLKSIFPCQNHSFYAILRADHRTFRTRSGVAVRKRPCETLANCRGFGRRVGISTADLKRDQVGW